MIRLTRTSTASGKAGDGEVREYHGRTSVFLTREKILSSRALSFGVVEQWIDGLRVEEGDVSQDWRVRTADHAEGEVKVSGRRA